MKRRIFRSMCGISLLSVLLACICVTGVLYKFSFDSMKTMIRDETVYVVAALNTGNDSGLAATRATFTRITLVDPDGTVVFDSVEDPARMGNHADRPEIARALQSGAAEAQRYSQTLAASTYYRAVRLENGQVVRVSGAMDSVWVTTAKYLPYLALVLVAAIAVSAVSAGFLARRIATPVNSVNLDDPLANDVYDELSPLLRRMEQQRQEIGRQLREMESQRREFETITAHMREGLLLVSADSQVLFTNESARRILHLQSEPQGGHILQVSRNEMFQQAVAQGLLGAAAEALLALSDREYQLLVTPVRDEGAVKGAVLLLLDVTDKQQAEQLRREFTANVSHELKTPLTSISGFAELIRDGVAKPQDVPAFAGRIYKETRRLITLVEDILRLSRLEESGGTARKTPLPLLQLCRDVAERLAPIAAEKRIVLEVTGDDVTIEGAPQVVEEMVGNLCDNAIKYGREGGGVQIAVEQRADGALLTVADNGIGIPREHRERVFERFYRVDKSHSKETGGTGLGLSIVKHGALLHGARLTLESTEGEGTAVCILFPREGREG